MWIVSGNSVFQKVLKDRVECAALLIQDIRGTLFEKAPYDVCLCELTFEQSSRLKEVYAVIRPLMKDGGKVVVHVVRKGPVRSDWLAHCGESFSGFRRFRDSLFWHGGDGRLARLLRLCAWRRFKAVGFCRRRSLARRLFSWHRLFGGRIRARRGATPRSTRRRGLAWSSTSRSNAASPSRPRHGREPSPRAQLEPSASRMRASDCCRRVPLKLVVVAIQSGVCYREFEGAIQQ